MLSALKLKRAKRKAKCIEPSKKWVVSIDCGTGGLRVGAYEYNQNNMAMGLEQFQAFRIIRLTGPDGMHADQVTSEIRLIRKCQGGFEPVFCNEGQRWHGASNLRIRSNKTRIGVVTPTVVADAEGFLHGDLYIFTSNKGPNDEDVAYYAKYKVGDEYDLIPWHLLREQLRRVVVPALNDQLGIKPKDIECVMMTLPASPHLQNRSMTIRAACEAFATQANGVLTPMSPSKILTGSELVADVFRRMLDKGYINQYNVLIANFGAGTSDTEVSTIDIRGKRYTTHASSTIYKSGDYFTQEYLKTGAVQRILPNGDLVNGTLDEYGGLKDRFWLVARPDQDRLTKEYEMGVTKVKFTDSMNNDVEYLIDYPKLAECGDRLYASVLKTLLEQTLTSSAVKTVQRIVLCGAGSYATALRRVLKRAGVPHQLVLKDGNKDIDTMMGAQYLSYSILSNDPFYIPPTAANDICLVTQPVANGETLALLIPNGTKLPALGAIRKLEPDDDVEGEDDDVSDKNDDVSDEDDDSFVKFTVTEGPRADPDRAVPIAIKKNVEIDEEFTEFGVEVCITTEGSMALKLFCYDDKGDVVHESVLPFDGQRPEDAQGVWAKFEQEKAAVPAVDDAPPAKIGPIDLRSVLAELNAMVV